MGSAALYHLARRGKRVLGLERFDLLHEHGSSHGLTRIIRLAYFEHPDYVPLLRRAYELWRELEAEAGEQLLHVTGIVEGGDRILDGVLRSCEEHDIPHEVLTGAEVAARFPAYRLPPAMDVVHPARRRLRRPRALHRRARRGRARARRDAASARARARVGGDGERRARHAPIEASSRPSASFSPPAPGRRTSRGFRPGSSAACASPSPGSSRRGRSSSSPTACPSSISRSTASTSTGSPRTASPASSSAATTTSGQAATPTRSRASRHSRTRRRSARSPSATSPTEPARRWRSRRASSSPRPTSTSSSTATRTRPGRRRRRLLGPRLQVLLGRRRDPRRPRDRRLDTPRHRPLPPRPLLSTDRHARREDSNLQGARRPNGT